MIYTYISFLLKKLQSTYNILKKNIKTKNLSKISR
jgi:hypothetical protein